MILKVKFGILQIAFWCAFGAFTSFIAAYMQSQGRTASFISMMLMFYTIASFAGQFFWGMISDALRSNKKVYILATVLLIVSEIMVFYQKNPVLLVLLYGVVGFIQMPIIVIVDIWLLKTFSQTPQVYGPIRSSASAVFMVFMLIFGNFIEAYGYQVMIIAAATFSIIAIITALLIKDISQDENNVVTIKKRPIMNNFQSLIGKYHYKKILLLLFGLGLASAPVFQLMPIIMNNIGGTVKYVGYSASIAALAQIPMMIISGRVNIPHPRKRLLVSGMIYTLAILGIALATSPNMVLLFCLISGVGFGLLLPAQRQYIFEIAPEGTNTTAQGIGDAVFNSLGSIFSSLLAFLMIDRFGIQSMLMVSFLIMFAILMVFMKRKLSQA